MADSKHEVVDLCQQGDRKAQMQLYTVFYKRVYNTCYRILRDSMEAEDAMQESFLKVFKNLHLYNRSISLEAWIVRIAINQSIDKIRKKDLNLVELNEGICCDHSWENDDDNWNEILDKVDKVKLAIEKLPDSSRIVLSLYLIEGYDHDEIAGILNIAPGTVRIQYMRAKKRLLEFLDYN